MLPNSPGANKDEDCNSSPTHFHISPNPRSVAQRFTCFECVLNSFLRLLLSAKRLEGLAFEIKKILLTYRRSRGHISAAEHFSDLVPDFHFVLCNVLAF